MSQGASEIVAKEQEPQSLRKSLFTTISMSDDRASIFKSIVVW